MDEKENVESTTEENTKSENQDINSDNPSSLNDEQLNEALKNASNETPENTTDKNVVKPSKKYREMDDDERLEYLEKTVFPKYYNELEPSEKIKFLENKVLKTSKQTKDKNIYIGKRDKEVGDLRKELKNKEALILLLKKEQENSYDDNEKQTIQSQIEGISIGMQSDISNIQASENMGLIKNTFPDFENMLEDIYDQFEIEHPDKASENVKKAFLENPYLETPDFILPLAQRASIRKKELQLKKEMESFKQNYGKKQKEENAFSLTSITSKNGGATSKKQNASSLSSTEIRNLSGDQIDSLLKKQMA
jgi:hypothetical protein